MTYISDRFSTISEQKSIDQLVRCLELQSALPSYQDYKKESFRLLRLLGGERILDIGSGLGDDLIELASLVGPSGELWGIDNSPAFIDLARERTTRCTPTPQFVLSDAGSLKLPDSHFGGARIDRILQHLPEPQRVVSEAFRVLSPGAVLVCAEPDWDTFVVASRHQDLTRRLLRYWGDHYRNPWIGRSLRGLFTQAGLTDVAVKGMAVDYPSWEQLLQIFEFDLMRETIDKLKIASLNEVDNWFAEQQERSGNGSFFAAVTIYLCSGVKP